MEADQRSCSEIEKKSIIKNKVKRILLIFSSYADRSSFFNVKHSCGGFIGLQDGTEIISEDGRSLNRCIRKLLRKFGRKMSFKSFF